MLPLRGPLLALTQAILHALTLITGTEMNRLTLSAQRCRIVVDCYLHSDDVVIASALQTLGHVCQIHACRQHLTSACPLQPPDTSSLLVNSLNTIEFCSPMLMFLSHRK